MLLATGTLGSRVSTKRDLSIRLTNAIYDLPQISKNLILPPWENQNVMESISERSWKATACRHPWASMGIHLQFLGHFMTRSGAPFRIWPGRLCFGDGKWLHLCMAASCGEGFQSSCFLIHLIRHQKKWRSSLPKCDVSGFCEFMCKDSRIFKFHGNTCHLLGRWSLGSEKTLRPCQPHRKVANVLITVNGEHPPDFIAWTNQFESSRSFCFNSCHSKVLFF